ncbi:MAG: OmpH/Skp family outer membrane protein [Planctomycetota bacterium]|jgi:Skp family chaperone for outer membrane proteins
MALLSRSAFWKASMAALLGGLIVALVGGATGSEAAPEGPPVAPAPGPRVAVVEMARVLRNSSEWQDSVAERVQLLETMKRTLNRLTRHVQVLRNEYENLPPDTEERRSKGEKIELALAELQQTRLEFEQRIAGQHGESVRSLFRKLSAAVRAYAEEHDIDLVLKKQDVELAGPETAGDNLLVATAEVLYAARALDISEPIIERLNAAYEGPIEVK